MVRVLVVHSSLFGANARLAGLVQEALEESGAQVRSRGVRQVVLASAQVEPAAAIPLASADDLEWAEGFVFTSPSHTGLPSAAIKAFVDENHDAAVRGAYVDKTFTAMATSGFAHAGQERVVDDLNAVAAAWGCVLVPPSTAFDRINALNGNPFGLSFVLSHGEIVDVESASTVLRLHLGRFVSVTSALARARTGRDGAAASPEHPARAVDALD